MRKRDYYPLIMFGAMTLGSAVSTEMKMKQLGYSKEYIEARIAEDFHNAGYFMKAVIIAGTPGRYLTYGLDSLNH